MIWPVVGWCVIAAFAVLTAGYGAGLWVDARRAAASQPPQGAAAYDAAWRDEAEAGIEREMRGLYSMAAGHPESLAAELGSADEAWLDAAARELWPHREYDYVTGEYDYESGEGDP